MNDPAREQWLATLDLGIAPYVDWLDSKGIETFESCEGAEGPRLLGADNPLPRRQQRGLPCPCRCGATRTTRERTPSLLADQPGRGAGRPPLGADVSDSYAYLQTLHSGRLAVPERQSAGVISFPRGHSSSLW